MRSLRVLQVAQVHANMLSEYGRVARVLVVILMFGLSLGTFMPGTAYYLALIPAKYVSAC